MALPNGAGAALLPSGGMQGFPWVRGTENGSRPRNRHAAGLKRGGHGGTGHLVCGVASAAAREAASFHRALRALLPHQTPAKLLTMRAKAEVSCMVYLG